MNSKSDDNYSDPEAQRRFMATVKAALRKPPKPHSEMKLGKPRAKPGKSPGKRKAVKKRESK